MSITVLMFRDTPWENWDYEKELAGLVSHIDCLDGVMLQGDVIHGNFEIQRISTGEKQAQAQYGYIVSMNDRGFHTDNLYMVLYGVGNPGNPVVAETARAVRETICVDAIDGYMIKDNCVLRFDGGAPAVREAFSQHSRTDFRVVH